MHHLAEKAIRAVEIRRTCGYYAAWKYIENNGVPPALYTLARVLDCAKAGGL